MGIPIFVKEYIAWHFGKAIRELFELEKTFLWFFYHLFSLPLLIRTFFLPFYKISSPYRKNADFYAFLETIIPNIVSRLIGMIARGVLLVLGILVELALLVAALPLIVLWLLLPFVIAMFFIAGIMRIF